MTIQTVQTVVYSVDGKQFNTLAEAEAYVAEQACTAVYRKFAETLQEGKSPKAVQMVVNVLRAFDAWKAEQEAAAAAAAAADAGQPATLAAAA